MTQGEEAAPGPAAALSSPQGSFLLLTSRLQSKLLSVASSPSKTRTQQGPGLPSQVPFLPQFNNHYPPFLAKLPSPWTASPQPIHRLLSLPTWHQCHFSMTKMRSTRSMPPPTSLCPPGRIIACMQMAFTCWGEDAQVGSARVSGTYSLGELSSTGDSRPYLKPPGQGDLTGIFRPMPAPSTLTGLLSSPQEGSRTISREAEDFLPFSLEPPRGQLLPFSHFRTRRRSCDQI